MTVLLLAAGVLIERRARERPLSERTRRRLGSVALGSLAAVPLVVLGRRSRSATAASAARSRTAGTTSRSEEQAPQNDPGRLIETGNVRTIYWARALDVWREHRARGRRRGLVRPGAAALPRPADAGPPRARLRAPDARRPRPARPRGQPRRAGRPGCSRPRATLASAPRRVAGGLDPRAHRAAGACAGGGRVRRALGDRLDLVRPGGRGHRPLLRRLGRRPRAARARRSRRRAPTSAEPVAACDAARARAAAAGPRWPPVRRPRRPGRAWRSRSRGAPTSEGDDALALLERGRLRRRARRRRARARDINPLSVEPYFERAAIEDAAGDRAARPRAARGRGAARAREPGGVAAPRRVLRRRRSTSRRARCRCCAARSSSTRPRR